MFGLVSTSRMFEQLFTQTPADVIATAAIKTHGKKLLDLGRGVRFLFCRFLSITLHRTLNKKYFALMFAALQLLSRQKLRVAM